MGVGVGVYAVQHLLYVSNSGWAEISVDLAGVMLSHDGLAPFLIVGFASRSGVSQFTIGSVGMYRRLERMASSRTTG
jgi:hypothetical protein